MAGMVMNQTGFNAIFGQMSVVWKLMQRTSSAGSTPFDVLNDSIPSRLSPYSETFQSGCLHGHYLDQNAVLFIILLRFRLKSKNSPLFKMANRCIVYFIQRPTNSADQDTFSWLDCSNLDANIRTKLPRH